MEEDTQYQPLTFTCTPTWMHATHTMHTPQKYIKHKEYAKYDYRLLCPSNYLFVFVFLKIGSYPVAQAVLKFMTILLLHPSKYFHHAITILHLNSEVTAAIGKMFPFLLHPTLTPDLLYSHSKSV